MQRRDFIKGSCSICLLIGAGMAVDIISSCAAPQNVFKTPVVNNSITIPASMFAEKELVIITPKDYEYNIALQKQKDGPYMALLMRCTHADNEVAFEGNRFFCHAHGSAFDTQGNVTEGPAERPLKKLKTTINHDQIIIQLS